MVHPAAVVLVLVSIAMQISGCTIRISDIDYVSFLLKSNVSIVNYTMEVPLGDASCSMLGGESINLRIDDLEAYYEGTIEFLRMVGNSSELINFYEMLKSMGGTGSGDYKKFCAAYHTYKVQSETSSFKKMVLDRIYDFTLYLFCDFLVSEGTSVGGRMPPVYRGENLTSASTAVLALRNYFANEELRKEAMLKRNSSRFVGRLLNSTLFYLDTGQSYLAGRIDRLLEYVVGIDSFDGYASDSWTSVRTISANVTGLYKFVKARRGEVIRLAMEHAFPEPFQLVGNYRNYLDILTTRLRSFARVFQRSFNSSARPRGLNAERVHWEGEYYNGSAFYLNETDQSEREILRIFDYIALSNLRGMWDPSTSDWKPTVKNSTSYFYFHKPRDHIRAIIEYSDRLRRSPYLYGVFGDSMFMEPDMKECLNGYPYYRDSYFGCPSTVFLTVPLSFSEYEEHRIRGGVDVTICDEWSGVLPPLQGWLQYLNAVLSPYLSIPFILPTTVISASESLSEQFSWAFFLRDGKVLSVYKSSDLPPFAEKCLIVKGFFLWMLVFVILFAVVLLVLTCIRFWSKYKSNQTASPIVKAMMRKQDMELSILDKRKKNEIFLDEMI